MFERNGDDDDNDNHHGFEYLFWFASQYSWFSLFYLYSGSTLTSLTTPSSNGATFETYSNGTETGDSASSNSRCAPGDKGCFAARLSGALIAPVALAFMAYALLIYKKRTVQILRRETVRYDDQRGPVVLVVVLIAVMIISYVISLIYVFWGCWPRQCSTVYWQIIN